MTIKNNINKHLRLQIIMVRVLFAKCLYNILLECKFYIKLLKCFFIYNCDGRKKWINQLLTKKNYYLLNPILMFV